VSKENDKLFFFQTPEKLTNRQPYKYSKKKSPIFFPQTKVVSLQEQRYRYKFCTRLNAIWEVMIFVGGVLVAFGF
jgi:hypothetical protein